LQHQSNVDYVLIQDYVEDKCRLNILFWWCSAFSLNTLADIAKSKTREGAILWSMPLEIMRGKGVMYTSAGIDTSTKTILIISGNTPQTNEKLSALGHSVGTAFCSDR